MTNNPNPSNPFPMGQKSNAGRRPGVPNKFTAELKEAFLQAANNAGFMMEVPRLDAEGKETGRDLICGEGGLVGYLTWAALHRPAAFIAQLGRILPLKVNARTEQRVKVEYESFEQALAELRASGLTDEKINLLLEDLR
jgi:hypothetical protein